MYLQPTAHCVHSGAELVPTLTAVFGHFYQPGIHNTPEQPQQDVACLAQAVQLGQVQSSLSAQTLGRELQQLV